jgi:hypothetical protein
MHLKKRIVCSVAIISFLFVQSPGISLAASYAAAQGSTKVTQNAPQFKTTAPEPIPTGKGKAGGKKGTVLWGIVGLAAVVGLLAAVVAGGSGGSSGGDKDKTTGDETGSVTVEW